MSKIALHLADGFEEIEALTVADILRRAEMEVFLVSITDTKRVVGAKGIVVEADKLFEEINYDEIDMIVLPGGMPGTTNLENHEELKKRIIEFDIDGKWIGAICAAPSILGKMAMLEDRKATCYPNFEQYLLGAEISTDSVVIDKNIITSRGPATAMEFGLKLVEVLSDQYKANRLAKGLLARDSVL